MFPGTLLEHMARTLVVAKRRVCQNHLAVSLLVLVAYKIARLAVSPQFSRGWYLLMVSQRIRNLKVSVILVDCSQPVIPSYCVLVKGACRHL